MRKCNSLGCISGVWYFRKRILKFHNSTCLDDADIDLLLRGVIRLIKRSIAEKIAREYEVKINHLNSEIDKLKRTQYKSY